MRVVMEVKVKEVPENYVEIYTMHPIEIRKPREVLLEEATVQKTIVRGRHFKNSRGEHVVIGLDKTVEDTIGLYFEGHEKLIKNNEDLSRYLRKANQDITDYENQLRFYTERSLWGRIKSVFVGNKL